MSGCQATTPCLQVRFPANAAATRFFLCQPIVDVGNMLTFNPLIYV